MKQRLNLFSIEFLKLILIFKYKLNICEAPDADINVNDDDDYNNEANGCRYATTSLTTSITTSKIFHINEHNFNSPHQNFLWLGRIIFNDLMETIEKTTFSLLIATDEYHSLQLPSKSLKLIHLILFLRCFIWHIHAFC